MMLRIALHLNAASVLQQLIRSEDIMKRSAEAARRAVNLTGLKQFFETVCLDAVELTGATRASIWYFEPNGSIVCQCLLDRRHDGFQRGDVIGRDKHAAYLDALIAEGIVAAEDARNTPATACFVEDYFVPNNIHALIDMLIRDADGRPAAVLCCEDCAGPRPWREPELMGLFTLAETIAATFRYQGASAAQRALFVPSLPFADKPLLMEAALYWAAKRSSQPMPRRSDLSPVDMPRLLLPHIVLADLAQNPFRVYYGMVGTEMQARYGRDFTGLEIDDFMTGDYGAYIRSLFRSVYDAAGPVYSESIFKWNDGGSSRTCRLMLPLSRDGGPVPDQVMVAQVWPDGGNAPMMASAMPVRADRIDNSLITPLNLPSLRSEASD